MSLKAAVIREAILVVDEPHLSQRNQNQHLLLFHIRNNKYSHGRVSSNLHKSPDRTKVLEDISNFAKKDSKIIDFLNNINDLNENPKHWNLKENKKSVWNSNQETWERDTQEVNEGYSEYKLQEDTIKSSQITDSYKSFSTMNNERSRSIENEEYVYNHKRLFTKCMKNPFA